MLGLLRIRLKAVWMIYVEFELVYARVDDLALLPLPNLSINPAMTRMFLDRRIS